MNVENSVVAKGGKKNTEEGWNVKVSVRQEEEGFFFFWEWSYTRKQQSNLLKYVKNVSPQEWRVT